MKSRSGEKIKLTSIDELLGVVNEESAMEIEINRIHAFKDHPFKVLDDEKMADLVESVKTYGVLTPVLLRSDGENGYEMISGHRRMHAAAIAGLATIPAIVRELSDDDAVIASRCGSWECCFPAPLTAGTAPGQALHPSPLP